MFIKNGIVKMLGDDLKFVILIYNYRVNNLQLRTFFSKQDEYRIAGNFVVEKNYPVCCQQIIFRWWLLY